MALNWYSAGTIAVANGGSVVTGSGTDWISNPQTLGSGILLPDGLIYEVSGVTSATSLSIKPNYKGATVGSGGAYQIAPMQGWARATSMQITELLAAASDLLALVPADKDIIQARSDSGAVAWTTRNQAQYSYDIFTGPPELNVASAATCDIGQAISHRIQITGTTPISSMGTVPNCIRYVRFGGVITIIYNPVSLILPGKSNITTAAGDNAIFTSDNAGNWRCIGFVRVSAPVMGGDYFWDENLAHGVKATNINTGPLTSVAFTVANNVNTGEIIQTGIGYAPTIGWDGPDLMLIRANGAGGASIVATQTGAPLRFGTTALERMQIDADGNVGIGRVPNFRLAIQHDTNAQANVSIGNSNTGNAAAAGFRCNNGVDAAVFYITSANFAASGLDAPNRAMLYSSGSGGMAINSAGAPFLIGTAGNERIRVDGNGSVMIASSTPLSSATKLTVYNPTDDPVAFAVKGAASSLRIGNNGNIASVEAVDAVNGNSAWKSLQLGGVDLRAVINSTERMRITTDGYLKASPNGSYLYPTFLMHEFNSVTDNTQAFIVRHAGASSPYGIMITFDAAPNNATNYFERGTDGAGSRYYLYSNGGLANYQANNANISDATLKQEITPYDPADLDALEASFVAVDWGKFKFADQTHSDWNHGYTAQSVEAAFAASAPELVDESEIGPKGEDRAPQKHKVVYATDLTNIGHALLARALQRIAQLEQRI